METRNPTLKKETFGRFRGAISADPADRMTIKGTLNKSIGLTLVAFVTAVLNFWVVQTSPALGIPVAFISMAVGFGTALVTVFKPEASPVTAPLYAAVEGLALGAISAIFNARFPGIVALAVPLTIAVMFLMLTLYRFGILKATPLFTKIIVLATCSIAVVYLINIVMGLFGTALPFLFTPSPLGIGISVVITCVAAFNFILDFDLIEQGSLLGAPKYMEWYGAFSICVTLFWLYIEILRLLSLLNRR